MATQKIFTRDFVLSFFAQFAFSSVFFILIPTIPIYLSRLGSKEAEIGVLVGVFSVSSLVLRPFVGRALLKIPERSFMIAGALLYAFSSIAYIIAKPFWPFLIVRILQGIGLALFATASFTLVTRISPEARRGQSIGYFYLAINIAFALAPLFGVAIVNLFDFPILFLVCTGLSLCSLFITLKLERTKIESLEVQSIRNQPFVSREALPSSIMAFMGSIIWGAVTAFLPLYALSHGVDNPGLFFAALAITLIVARSLGGKILDIYAREKVILPCLLAQIIAMSILIFSTTLPMFILVAVIWGMGTAFFYPALVAYVIDLAGPSRGPAIGTYMALSDFGAGMGSVIMGIVLQLTNYPIMFLCLAFTGVINLLYFYFAVRKKGGGQHAHL
ncbi:MAG: MFS transporter [Desulfobacterales bacterium]|nr:MFS transporter [Desulfobacterales bacterium]